MTRALLTLVLAALLAGLSAPAASAQTARAAKRAPARARAAAVDSGATTRSRVAPRTLDEIHIEGEIPVPQVLFITARDQRRFMEFQHHRYQRTSLELGQATPIPTRLVVTTPQPVQRKENPR